MELRSFRYCAVFRALLRAIPSVSGRVGTGGSRAVFRRVLLTLGVVGLSVWAPAKLRVRVNGSGAEGSTRWWPSESVHAQGGGAPTFTTFEAPGAGTGLLQGTTGLGINAAGDIAGIFVSAPNVSTPNLAHGFLRTAATGTITPFDAPGAGTAKNQGTFAIAIDTAGDVTGLYADSGNAYHGFIRAGANGTITPFDVPGAPTAIGHRGTVPLSINGGGDITGEYVDVNAVRHGFVRLAASGMITPFDAPGAGTGSTDGTVPINIGPAGDVTGYYKGAGGAFHGFIRKAGTGTITAPIDAPGASSGPSGKVAFSGTLPTSIDATGNIVGIYSDSNGLYHGFIRGANGTFTAPIDAPGAAKGGLFPGTFPASMNGSGVVAGFYEGANGLNHGFVRAADGTFTAPLDAPGASGANFGIFPGGTANISLNDSGVVAGGYLDVNGTGHGFSLTLPLTLPQAAMPTFNPPAGTYAAAQSVTVADTTPGAAIHFTTDGSTPGTSSPLFSAAIPVNSSETIKAIAVANGFSNSAVASAAYVINAPAPDFQVSVNPTRLTIVAGKSGQATFTVTPENGFNSLVSFACSGLPAEATCDFNPPNVTPNGAPVSSTLTVKTMAPGAGMRVPAPNSPRSKYALVVLVIAVMFGMARRRRWALSGLQFLAALLLLVLATGFASCGGGGGGNGGTPTGTSVASVSASLGSGGSSHAAALTIIITH